MNEVIKCLLCEKEAKFVTLHKGYQEPEKFGIYHCEFCDTSFSMPRVDTSSIYQLIYESGSQVSGYDRYWRYKKNVLNSSNPIQYLIKTEECYWSIYEAIKSISSINKKSNILEIGSGLGYLTYSLYKDGYENIKGLDISKEAVAQATKTFGDHYINEDLFAFSNKNSELYDAVILTEVIEHIDEPLVFIRSIKNLLRKDGVIILTTPNKSFWPSWLNWYTDFPPVHCWWFSEDSFKSISSKLDMKINFIDFKSFYFAKRKKIIDVSKLENNEGNHQFDKLGNLIIYPEKKHKTYLPRFMKKNALYNVLFSFLYQSTLKNYIKGGSRTDTMCVVLTK